MSPSLLASLILCNLAWSANPVMVKLILQDFAPVHAGWLRYGSALAAYLAYAALSGRGIRGAFARPRSARDAAWFFLLGFMPFVFSTLLNTAGLASTQATDNALIVAIEPLITVLVARVLVGEPIRLLHVGSIGLALAGFSLLSGITPGRIAAGLEPRLVGNLLILLSLVGEGSYSSCFRKLQGRYEVVPMFGTSLLIGVACLTAVSIAVAGPPPLQHLTARSALATAFLGPVGGMATYLFWLLALSRAAIPSLAVTLYVQPLAGALWGAMFLQERLSAAQWTGGLLILVSVSMPAVLRDSKGDANSQP